MLKLKLQYFGHMMWRAKSLEKTLMLGKTEGRRRRGWQRRRWLVDIINSMDMSLSKLREVVMNRETWRAAVHAVRKIRMRLSNWTMTMWKQVRVCDVYTSRIDFGTIDFFLELLAWFFFFSRKTNTAVLTNVYISVLQVFKISPRIFFILSFCDSWFR